MIGRSIGNYKVLEKISQTETVEIYKAVDILLDRNVLIKALAQDFSKQSGAAEDFRFEAATLAKLGHPGISTLHSLTETDDLLFMVLEFADGETLAKVLRRGEKLPFEEAVSIFVRVLDALEYSHKFGIAHGNLKTSNIILTDAGAVKVSDFGTRAHSQKTEASDDIYALGAIFFETVTGKSLIDFENSLEVKGNLTREMRKHLYSVDPFIPEEIKTAIIKAAQPTRDERFPTATAFRDVLLAHGFDEPKIKDEISLSETLVADALPFTRLEPFGLIDNLGDLAKNSPVASPETASNDKNIAVYSVNFSPGKNQNRSRKSGSNPISANEQTAAQNKNFFLQNSGKSRLTIVGAGILALLLLHFVWQISLIQSENPRVVEMPIQTGQSEKQIVAEIEPEYEAKNRDIVKPPKIVAPVEPPLTEIKPSQTVFRKKAPVETRAERLRRVEKALTGI